MSGKLQTAADVEAGKVMLEQLGSLSEQTAQAAALVRQIGMNYRQFRDSLGGDAGDEAFADASLQRAIARDKATLDTMDPADKAVVDTYLQGLGYAKA